METVMYIGVAGIWCGRQGRPFVCCVVYLLIPDVCQVLYHRWV